MKQKSVFREVLLPLLMILCFALDSNEGFAQCIKLDLSAHANKKVTLMATAGVRQDTIQSIILDAKGKGIFNLHGIKSQAGILKIQLKTSSPPDAEFSWVYSPTENPTIVSNGEYIHKQNAQILNSVENSTLDRWYINTYIFQQRIALNQELGRLYPPTDPIVKHLQAEKAKNEVSLKMLNDSINHSLLFAARFMQFSQNAQQKLSQASLSDSSRNIARDYFQSLDFEALHGTGQWFNTINAIIEVYAKGTNSYEKFGLDVLENLKRIKNLLVYTDLADAAVSICEKYSWGKDQDTIVDFLIADNRLQNPTGKLNKLLAFQKVKVGNKAPDLVIGLANQNPQIRTPKSMLLVFYESGCGNCEVALSQLVGNYENIKNQGFEMVSIAADHDEPTFKKTAANLPWADKYCDMKGFAGANFKNYAIIGTPTMFLIDKQGIIQAKMASVAEIIEELKKINANN